MVSRFFIGTSLEIVSCLQWAIISQWISSHRLSCRYMGYILLRYHATPLTCNMRLSSAAFALGEGPTRRGLSHTRFYAAAANCASSRHSILRLWRDPSPRAYSRGIISHRLSCRCSELCLFEALYPAPLARPFSKGLLEGDYFTWTFIPLRRVVPLRGTLSCAFGAALLQGPTRGRNILVPSHSFFISFRDGVK